MHLRPQTATVIPYMLLANPTIKAVFNRIIAKRSVFHCFMGTQAKMMAWTHKNTLYCTFAAITVDLGNGLSYAYSNSEMIIFSEYGVSSKDVGPNDGVLIKKLIKILLFCDTNMATVTSHKTTLHAFKSALLNIFFTIYYYDDDQLYFTTLISLNIS